MAKFLINAATVKRLEVRICAKIDRNAFAIKAIQLFTGEVLSWRDGVTL